MARLFNLSLIFPSESIETSSIFSMVWFKSFITILKLVGFFGVRVFTTVIVCSLILESGGLYQLIEPYSQH